MPQIVTINVSQQVAPTPSVLQQTGGDFWFPSQLMSRLAYSPDYLGSQGWRYARTADPRAQLALDGVEHSEFPA